MVGRTTIPGTGDRGAAKEVDEEDGYRGESGIGNGEIADDPEAWLGREAEIEE